MGAVSLFEFILAAHEGIEQGLDAAQRTSPHLALVVNEASMTVPFHLSFQQSGGFRALATKVPRRAHSPLNLARMNIRWRLCEYEENRDGKDSFAQKIAPGGRPTAQR